MVGRVDKLLKDSAGPTLLRRGKTRGCKDENLKLIFPL